MSSSRLHRVRTGAVMPAVRAALATPQASTTTSGLAIGGGNYRQSYVTVDGAAFNNAFGIGGKSYVVLSGNVADMNAAVDAGSAVASEKGFLVNRVVIPRPHKQLIDQIM